MTTVRKWQNRTRWEAITRIEREFGVLSATEDPVHRSVLHTAAAGCQTTHILFCNSGVCVANFLKSIRLSSSCMSLWDTSCKYMYKHVGEVCSPYLFFLCCSDMSNRSIAWWLRENGLSQYTKILESGYYGLEVCARWVRASVFLWWHLISREHMILFYDNSSHCFIPGFAEGNRWRAEGRRDRRCKSQTNHFRRTFKAPAETGTTLWQQRQVHMLITAKSHRCI